jgi:hypothetical protein
MSYTVKTTKVTAASDSLADIFDVLHTHFEASTLFQTLLPASVGGEHTIYFQSRTVGQMWRFALSSIGGDTGYAAGSLEPNRLVAPAGIDPTTGATAQWSGQASRMIGARSKFMLVTEIVGLARDSIFIQFYTDTAGVRAFPLLDTLHFGRILSPLLSEVPGLDGLAFICGVAGTNATAGAFTGTSVTLISRNISGDLQNQRTRMRHGPTAWNMMRWQWLSARATSAFKPEVQAGNVIEPLPVGTNTATLTSANSHDQTPMIAHFNHIALWAPSSTVGTKITDSVNQREFMFAGLRVLTRVEFGFDVTP